jgi:hypothetical protein
MEVVGTFTTQNQEFSALWTSHDLLRYRSGAKLLSHPDVGDLEFGYESFELSTDPGLVILVFTVEPSSPTAEAMQLLATWAATRIPRTNRRRSKPGRKAVHDHHPDEGALEDPTRWGSSALLASPTPSSTTSRTSCRAAH